MSGEANKTTAFVIERWLIMHPTSTIKSYRKVSYPNAYQQVHQYNCH